MGIYQGVYQSYKKETYGNFRVFRSDNNPDGIINSDTTYDEDNLILPNSYVVKFRPKSRILNTRCGLGVTPRRVLLYVSINQWFTVPLPFYPNSLEWLNFFNEIRTNNAIIEVEYRGESD